MMTNTEYHDRNIFGECLTYIQAISVNLFENVPPEYMENIEWKMSRPQYEREWDNPQVFMKEVDMIYIPLDEESRTEYKLRFEMCIYDEEGDEIRTTFERILNYHNNSGLANYLGEQFDEVRQAQEEDEEEEEEEEEEDEDEDEEEEEEDPVSVIDWTVYI